MTTSPLIFTQAQLMRNDECAQPHVIQGRRLHGGFDSAGVYIPPRSQGRTEALTAWTDALVARGGSLFPLHPTLLDGPLMPNVAQQRLLIRNGMGQIFWNFLTMTSKLEARGRMMVAWDFAELQAVVTQDISQMAIGHLSKGLLTAHGMDEGGEPKKGIGGHDMMWLAVRDLLFDVGSYPDDPLAASIRRPMSSERLMPELSKDHGALLSYLITMLMIEVRAEIGFSATQAVCLTPDLFTDRCASAELAAQVIERIRKDEAIHVWSLQLYLGEISLLTFKTEAGGEVSGAELIERFWTDLIKWSVHEHPRLYAQKQYEMIKSRILKLPEGEALMQQFDALSDIRPEAVHTTA